MDEGGCALCGRPCDRPHAVQRIRFGDGSPIVGVTEPAETRAETTIVQSGASATHSFASLHESEYAMPQDEQEEQTDPCETQIIETPAHTARKPWMDYRAVTDTSSVQYELLSRSWHADNGLLYVDGCLCVALGSKWGEVGTRYTFRMSTGDEIPVIKCDEKQDIHTAGGEGWTGEDGHLIEMIVDTDCLDEEAMLMGDCDCLVPGTVEVYSKQ